MFNRGEVNGVEVGILKSNNPGPSQGEYQKQQVISELPVASFSNRAWCSSFHMKMRFHSHAD